MRWVRVSLMWAHGHLRSESRGSSVAAWRSDWQHYGSVTPKSVMSLLQSESFNLMNNVSDEPSPFINLFEASGLKLSYKVKHLTIDIWHIFVICQYCQVLVKKNNQLQPSPNKFKLVPRVGDGLTLKYPGPPNWTFRHETPSRVSLNSTCDTCLIQQNVCVLFQLKIRKVNNVIIIINIIINYIIWFSSTGICLSRLPVHRGFQF